MTRTLHGTVRGKTIELDEDPGAPDGQAVEVQVTVVSPDAAAPRMPRRPGTLRGTVLYMAPDFDAPLEDFKEYME